MVLNKNSSALILTILLGIFLQVILIFADTTDTPSRAVVGFSKAYFKFDSSMADRICSELGKAEIDPVEHYIHAAKLEAKARGVNLNYLKNEIYKIHTEIISQDDNSAKVHLTGIRRISINPAFAWVAKIFCIGKTHEVEEIIQVVKEEGRWKICGNPFFLGSV